MQKWEYLDVSVTYGSGTECFLYISGERQRVTTADVQATRLLNRFGEQGWELVAFESPASIYIFKRPNKFQISD
jgi:hypothetical protein